MSNASATRATIARCRSRSWCARSASQVLSYDQDVEDWMARAAQSTDQAARARRLIAEAIGTRKFGAKKVWRDEDGKLWFSVRWAILVATKLA